MLKSFLKIEHHIFIIFLNIIFIYGCTNPATKAFKQAQKKQSQGYNDLAIELYKKSLEKGGNKGKLNYLIAENYRITNRMREAAPYYAEAIKGKSKEDKLNFYYAQALEAHGNYEEARVGYEKYAKKGLNKGLKKQAAEEAKFLRKIKELINKETYYNVKSGGKFINTKGPEYAPIISKEGEIIYTAENTSTTYKATSTGYTDIYTFKIGDSLNAPGSKREFEKSINDANTHEACLTINEAGDYLVFAKSNNGKRKGSVDTDLFFSEMRDGEWTKPELLNISDPRAWESTPALTPDGKTLYFSSTRKGGQGAIDLWKSTLSDSGWTKPKNLGPKINTAGNDMFPYVRKDGQFFFASDGHPGLGSLDLFAVVDEATMLDSTETEEGIINLGPPINTNADDFGIVYKDNFKGGYFSSNRDGGQGDDDIYEFWLAAKPRRPIVNIVNSFLTVSILGRPGKDETGFKILDSASVELEFESGETFLDSVTNKEGIVTFLIDTNSTYYIKADKKGYFTSNIPFNTSKTSFREEQIGDYEFNRYYSTIVELDRIEIGKEIVLKNILYDYNKYDIREDAEIDLDLLIDFLSRNQELIIELGSHTDSRGNADYNMRLSRLRAQSAVDYIVKAGIEKERIKAVGYGATKHLIENAQTEEEHQVNRRTEFKIVASKE